MGKLAAALRRMGFRYVYDTCFGADLTIMEEANEFSRNLRTVRQRNSPYLQAAAPAGCAFSKESSRN